MVHVLKWVWLLMSLSKSHLFGSLTVRIVEVIKKAFLEHKGIATININSHVVLTYMCG